MSDELWSGAPVIGQLIHESMLADNGLEPGVVLPAMRQPAPFSPPAEAAASAAPLEAGDEVVAATASSDEAEIVSPEQLQERETSDVINPEQGEARASSEVPLPDQVPRQGPETEPPEPHAVVASEMPESPVVVNRPQPDVITPEPQPPVPREFPEPEPVAIEAQDIPLPDNPPVHEFTEPQAPELQSLEVSAPEPPELVVDDEGASEAVPLPVMQELTPGSFPVIDMNLPREEDSVTELELDDVVWELPKELEWTPIENPFRDQIAMDSDDTMGGQAITNDRNGGF